LPLLKFQPSYFWRTL